MNNDLGQQSMQHKTKEWFYQIRDKICSDLMKLEQQFSDQAFVTSQWDREGGGGGEMRLLQGGNLFEKAGVNVSCVHGLMKPEYADKVVGLDPNNPEFFATGLSIVIHPRSPLIPAVHFNCRYVKTTQWWFGGGMDMTPVFNILEDTEFLHNELKKICDKRADHCYDLFKKQCDEYFFLKHRNEPRGVGGIFFEYLNSDFDNEWSFVQELCSAFTQIYVPIVEKYMHLSWTQEQKQAQLEKRARYVEFNLLYDRGTKFGLMTNGNIEAIFMSLPPMAAFVTKV